MLEPVLKNPWVRAIGVLAAIVLLGFLVYILRPVLIPLFLAFLVAYILDPVVDVFEARGVSRGRVITSLAVLGAIILVSFPFLVGASILRQTEEMVRAARASSMYESGWLDKVADRLPLNEFVRIMGWVDAEGRIVETATPVIPREQWEEIALPEEPPVPLAVPGAIDPDWVEPDAVVPGGEAGDVPVDQADESEAEAVENLPVVVQPDPLAVIAEKTAEAIRNNSLQFFRTNAQSIATAGQRAGLTITGFAAYIGNTILQSILFIANFALFAFVAGYLLKDFDKIVASTGELIPRKYAAKTKDIAGQIDDQLRGFLRGQMTVALCLGAMYFVGFLISGVPFAFLIALFGIVASFIPFVGVILVAIIAFVMTLITHQFDWHLLGVLATVGIAQFLEGNVLTPKIVGDKVGLNPVWVILAIMVFGNFLGFLGLLLAVPIAASLKVLVVEAVKYYKTSPVFVADGEPSSSDDSE